MKRQEDRAGAGPNLSGGAMGEAINAKDWTGHALGTIEKWPLSLRTALGICLGFPAPSCIAWGERRSQLYNDAYSQVSGIRHAEALGVDFRSHLGARMVRDAWLLRASGSRRAGAARESTSLVRSATAAASLRP